MSTEVSTRQEPKWKVTMAQAMPAIVDSLPEHVTPKKFEQVARTAIGRNDMLRECLESNPKKVLTALADCASDGLLPDNKQAALVPFNNRRNGTIDLNYIPMISGVLQRMRQSGEITSISAAIVHENDEFEFIQGDEERLTHKPNWSGDRGKRVAAYAIIRLTSGEVYREVMSAREIDAVKQASKAKGGPWSGPFESEMWRKTVLKRAAKYCPVSSDAQRMLDRDNSLYDPDKMIDAAPKRSMVERFTEAPAIEHDEIDDGPTDLSPTQAVVIDQEAEASAPPLSEDASASAPFPGDEPPADISEAQKFYQGTLQAMKVSPAAEKSRWLNDAKSDPLWEGLSASQQNIIIKAAETK